MEPAPEHCPGVDSAQAGRESACQGCPNQSICSDPNKRLEDDGKSKVTAAMRDVKRKVLVLSGKGGVGKSTVTALLARYLARQHSERNFGVLDIDICGPSQPRLLGVADEKVHQSGSGWSPVAADDNLCLMSIGFLISSPDDAIIWRGPKKNGMIRQFLSEVDWDALDVLLIDTPPGTSDEHLSIVSYLRDDSLYAIIVTTPQEVALLDVRKEIDFCRKQGINVLGVVENMSCYTCAKCQHTTQIFPAKTGGAAAMCADMAVPYLGALQLDVAITKACDVGNDYVRASEHDKENPNTKVLGEICEKLLNNL